MSEEETEEQLLYKQRLKAAMFYRSMKICEKSAEEEKSSLDKQVIATISEAVWKRTQQVASDLEMFAKHGKRTTITADDVKLLVRNSPSLLNHLTSIHEKHTEGKPQAKKPKKGTKQKTTSTTSVTMETDDSNLP